MRVDAEANDRSLCALGFKPGQGKVDALGMALPDDVPQSMRR